ncbi:MAG: ABC transporter substrate-binding protein [Candidatus Promineifilaceae bacterium]
MRPAAQSPGRAPGRLLLRLAPACLLGLLVACQQNPPSPPTAVLEPEPTSTATSEPAAGEEETPATLNFITVAVDAPSRHGDFSDIDPFGNVIGFDPGLMAYLAARLGLDHEFVVSSFSGLLDSVAFGEFDAAMSALVIPDEPQEGLAYTIPYLEVAQVLLLRANEVELASAADIGPGMTVGVQRFSSGEEAARELLGLSEPQLELFDQPAEMIQSLIDNALRAVVLDSDDARYFTTAYPLQLKVAGGPDEAAWLSHKRYGIAVAAGNERLLRRLNEAIAGAQEEGAIEPIIQEWLVAEDNIVAGESLVGTPADELVIGITGVLNDLDPAARDLDWIGWEVKANVMSGLYRLDANNTLQPLLAAGPPQVSADGLEYTIPLRPGLTFPDGSAMNAEDVKFSFDRAAGLGNFLINGTLRDANEDNFADDDSVQVIDPQTVKIVLQEATSYFPSLLATPPFAVVSPECFTPAFDAATICGGIGPYTVVSWEVGVQLQLRANPGWPAEAARFNNIQLHFYDDPTRMRRSLENGALDIAWTGLPEADVQALSAEPAFRAWVGAMTFKSYLVFDHSQPPWNNARLRSAIAHSVDRELLANEVFDGRRRPLYSPVPDSTAGHVAAEPERDLDVARAALLDAGYTESQKLEMTLWFVNDGRYSAVEDAYANALKAQLEETGLIAVTVEGAPYDIFRPQSASCNYPAFLLGWPPAGQPAMFPDAMSWMEYFITNTDDVCSNYQSQAMTELYEQALRTADEAARLQLYAQMQELWATEFPSLDLTQEGRVAIAQPAVDNVVIDAMGLMHYETLSKESE